MELLKKVAAYCENQEEFKNIYILFVRSILKQSATVWHSSLSEENRNDLERVQKTALKLILGQKHNSYRHALNKMNLEDLDERRENLCLTFAQRTSRHPTMKKMFPLNEKSGGISTRHPEKYKVQHALNERLRKSPIIHMQNLLNQYQEKL